MTFIATDPSPSIDAGAPDQFDSRVALVHKTMADCLRVLRESKKLTQVELCRDTGLGRSTIGNIESRCLGNVDSLVRMAVALGLGEDLHNLFERRLRAALQ